jgi:hypothetical protein
MASRVGTPIIPRTPVGTPASGKPKSSNTRIKPPKIVEFKNDIPAEEEKTEDAYNTELYSILKREQSINKKLEVAIKRAQNNHKVRAQLAVSYIKKIGVDPTSPDALLHKV